MPLALRHGISFCDIDETRIFLDLDHDRYFSLGDAANEAFSAVVHGETPSAGQILRIDRLIASGILVDDRLGERPRACPSLAIVGAALDKEWSIRPRPTKLLAVACALQSAKLELRFSRLAKICERVTLKKRLGHLRRRRGELDELTAIAHLFAASGGLVQLLDQCLPLSLALMRWVLAAGIDADLVFGVKLRPFQAHAWVSAGGTLMTDRLAMIAQFTPILIL